MQHKLIAILWDDGCFLVTADHALLVGRCSAWLVIEACQIRPGDELLVYSADKVSTVKTVVEVQEHKQHVDVVEVTMVNPAGTFLVSSSSDIGPYVVVFGKQPDEPWSLDLWMMQLSRMPQALDFALRTSDSLQTCSLIASIGPTVEFQQETSHQFFQVLHTSSIKASCEFYLVSNIGYHWPSNTTLRSMFVRSCWDEKWGQALPSSRSRSNCSRPGSPQPATWQAASWHILTFLFVVFLLLGVIKINGQNHVSKQMFWYNIERNDRRTNFGRTNFGWVPYCKSATLYLSNGSDGITWSAMPDMRLSLKGRHIIYSADYKSEIERTVRELPKKHNVKVHSCKRLVECCDFFQPLSGERQVYGCVSMGVYIFLVFWVLFWEGRKEWRVQTPTSCTYKWKTDWNSSILQTAGTTSSPRNRKTFPPKKGNNMQ